MAENKTYDLSSFISSNFLRSCHEIGRGAYGTVHEVTVNGVRCIAKVIHEILKPQGRSRYEEHAENIVSVKFTRECELLNSLRHPNIVQCFGIHEVSFGNNRSEDVLLMEYMHMDLDHCLSKYPNIVLPIKFSVLCDVSHGLLHLHIQKPPIIHRDLTASNILLTPDMRAKIADLGMCRTLELKDALRLTQAPGALAYMPPEALTEEPNYDLKLDIFSFGVVALFVGNQDLPIPFEVKQSAILPEALEKNEIQLLKRKRWMNQLGTAHPLYQLITKCLQDTPDLRPVTSDLCSDMEKLCDQYPWMFENILKSDVPDEIRRELEKQNEVLLSTMCDMEAVLRDEQEKELIYRKKKEEEFEGMIKEYRTVQKQLGDAKLEFERKLLEIKQEYKCTLLEKELQQFRMQREIEEEKRLLHLESMKKDHEYKQILEHLLSKQGAETLFLQKKMHQIEEHGHKEVQTLQDEVKEFKSANELLHKQMHQIEELRHNEVQTLQDEIKELRTANELLQQQKYQIENHCLELKNEVQVLKKNVKELEDANITLQVQAEGFQDDFRRERRDREVLAGRLSTYEEIASQKTRWFTSRRNPKDTT